jgi:RNA polymerase sigma-70 factor (ECF subfamily)
VARAIEERLTVAKTAVLDVAAAYDAHADFVWQSLHRLGVRRDDMADLLQEAFLVVHRRREEADPARPLRGWLWGICVMLVRNYRRRAFRTSETALEGDVASGGDGPEAAMVARRQRERGQRALGELDPEKRAVFVMFEVEGMSGKEIAELLDVPVGTVHSRLHGARAELSAALAEEEA